MSVASIIDEAQRKLLSDMLTKPSPFYFDALNERLYTIGYGGRRAGKTDFYRRLYGMSDFKFVGLDTAKPKKPKVELHATAMVKDVRTLADLQHVVKTAKAQGAGKDATFKVAANDPTQWAAGDNLMLRVTWSAPNE